MIEYANFSHSVERENDGTYTVINHIDGDEDTLSTLDEAIKFADDHECEDDDVTPQFPQDTPYDQLDNPGDAMSYGS